MHIMPTVSALFIRATVVLIMTSNILVKAQDQNNVIRNLVRFEGECHVYISCPIYGPASPSWKINNTIFSVSSLQNSLYFQPVYSGLEVISVNQTLNEIPIQCIISSKGSQEAIGGPISTITVLSPGLENTCSRFNPFLIHADPQRLLFSNNITFAWKVIKRPGNQSPMCDQLTFLVQLKNCSGDVQGEPRMTESHNITLQYSDLGRDGSNVHYITIRGFYCDNNTCECESSSFSFEVDSHNIRTKMINVGLGQEYCFEVPARNERAGTLHVLLPFSLTERDRKDVDCPLYFGSGDDLMLYNCSDFMTSMYRHNTVLVRDRNGHKICIRNVTKEFNNTRIHFFYETSECNLRSFGQFATSQSYHRFVRSYWLMAREVPDTPNVTINDGGQMCIHSENKPPAYFEIVICDITKEKIFNITQNGSISCTNISNFLEQHDCAPYEITVRAYGEHNVFSEITVTEQNDTDADICGCVMKNRVNITSVKASKDGENVRIVIVCNHNFVSAPNMSLHIMDSTNNENTTFYFLCNRTSTSPINLTMNLSRSNSHYYYSIFWNDDCDILDDTLTISSQNNELEYLYILLLIPIVCTIIIIIVAVILRVKKGGGVELKQPILKKEEKIQSKY